MAVQLPLKISTSFYIAHATSTLSDYYSPLSSSEETIIISCFKIPRLSRHSFQRRKEKATDAADIPNTFKKVVMGSHWPFFHFAASSRRPEPSSSSRKLRFSKSFESQKNPPEVLSDSTVSVPEADGDIQIKASEDGGDDIKCDLGVLLPSLLPSNLNGILEINAGSGDGGKENKLNPFDSSSGLRIKQDTLNLIKTDHISYALNHSDGFDLLLDKWRGQLPWISSKGANRKSMDLLGSPMILMQYKKKEKRTLLSTTDTTDTDEDEKQSSGASLF